MKYWQEEEMGMGGQNVRPQGQSKPEREERDAGKTRPKEGKGPAREGPGKAG